MKINLGKLIKTAGKLIAPVVVGAITAAAQKKVAGIVKDAAPVVGRVIGKR